MIPNGPAKIEWTRTGGAGLRFRFVSFPAACRRLVDATGNYELLGAVDNWAAYSLSHPNLGINEAPTPNVLWCPGSGDEQDDESVRCRGGLTPDILTGLLDDINRRFWGISDQIAALLGL